MAAGMLWPPHSQGSPDKRIVWPRGLRPRLCSPRGPELAARWPRCAQGREVALPLTHAQLQADLRVLLHCEPAQQVPREAGASVPFTLRGAAQVQAGGGGGGAYPLSSHTWAHPARLSPGAGMPGACPSAASSCAHAVLSLLRVPWARPAPPGEMAAKVCGYVCSYRPPHRASPGQDPLPSAEMASARARRLPRPLEGSLWLWQQRRLWPLLPVLGNCFSVSSAREGVSPMPRLGTKWRSKGRGLPTTPMCSWRSWGGTRTALSPTWPARLRVPHPFHRHTEPAPGPRQSGLPSRLSLLHRERSGDQVWVPPWLPSQLQPQ